jgi:hypothetical protein
MAELKEARTAWENRTGKKSQNDGLDDDLAFCLRLESRSSDLEGLPETPLLNKLTMFEQALLSWATSLDFTLRLYSAQCEAWTGIRPLEGITATPAPATTLPAALVYGGRIRVGNTIGPRNAPNPARPAFPRPEAGALYPPDIGSTRPGPDYSTTGLLGSPLLGSPLNSRGSRFESCNPPPFSFFGGLLPSDRRSGAFPNNEPNPTKPARPVANFRPRFPA